MDEADVEHAGAKELIAQLAALGAQMLERTQELQARGRASAAKMRATVA